MSVSKSTITYDSNPFTTSLTAVRKIFSVNPQGFIGVMVSILGVCAVIGASAMTFLLAAVVFLARHYAEGDSFAMPAYLQQMFFTNIPDGVVYALWGGSLVVGILGIAFAQALQLHFTVVTARGDAAPLGQTLRASLRHTIPLLGLGGLAFLATILLLILVGLLSASPAMLFLLGGATIAGVIYASLRLAFAGYAIVDKKLGPLTAIVYSWRVTDGRVIDILGVAALTSIMFIVPDIIFGALAKVSENTPGLAATFDIVNLVVQMALIIIASMPLAERFVQSVAVYDGQAKAKPTSPLNFLAIVLMLVLTPIDSALAMPTSDNADPYDSLGIPSLEQAASPNFPQGSSNVY